MAHDLPQASLAQVSALQERRLIPEASRRALAAFLQEAQAPAAPEAMGYEFHAHGIIEMLEKLLDKFQGERTSIENQERTNAHEYDILIKDLTAQINNAKERLSVIVPARAKLLEDLTAQINNA